MTKRNYNLPGYTAVQTAGRYLYNPTDENSPDVGRFLQTAKAYGIKNVTIPNGCIADITNRKLLEDMNIEYLVGWPHGLMSPAAKRLECGDIESAGHRACYILSGHAVYVSSAPHLDSISAYFDYCVTDRVSLGIPAWPQEITPHYNTMLKILHKRIPAVVPFAMFRADLPSSTEIKAYQKSCPERELRYYILEDGILFETFEDLLRQGITVIGTPVLPEVLEDLRAVHKG